MFLHTLDPSQTQSLGKNMEPTDVPGKCEDGVRMQSVGGPEHSTQSHLLTFMDSQTLSRLRESELQGVCPGTCVLSK